MRKRSSVSSSKRGGSRRQVNTKVSSRKSTGVYTKEGNKVHSVEAYTRAGGKTYTRRGEPIKFPAQYERKVKLNSIQSAAKAVMERNPDAKAFSYQIKDSSSGKTYVGMTRNPSNRLADHLLGKGAKATQQMKMSHVHLTPHRSVKDAKTSETRQYFEQKRLHGVANVRGAGHTKRFYPSQHHPFG